MQDGCKVDMDSYMASNGSCFMVTWTIFKNHLLEVGFNTNREIMALRNLTIIGLFYFYNVWGPAWIDIHWNGIWLRVWSHMTFTLHSRVCGHTTWFWRYLETAFGYFLLGSHNFMVTTLGSFVKWPLMYFVFVGFVLWEETEWWSLKWAKVWQLIITNHVCDVIQKC